MIGVAFLMFTVNSSQLATMPPHNPLSRNRRQVALITERTCNILHLC